MFNFECEQYTSKTKFMVILCVIYLYFYNYDTIYNQPTIINTFMWFLSKVFEAPKKKQSLRLNWLCTLIDLLINRVTSFNSFSSRSTYISVFCYQYFPVLFFSYFYSKTFIHDSFVGKIDTSFQLLFTYLLGTYSNT